MFGGSHLIVYRNLGDLYKEIQECLRFEGRKVKAGCVVSVLEGPIACPAGMFRYPSSSRANTIRLFAGQAKSEGINSLPGSPCRRGERGGARVTRLYKWVKDTLVVLIPEAIDVDPGK